MLPHTDQRDDEQVVLHWSKKNLEGDKKSDHYIVMVDQLWLWIFGGKISSEYSNRNLTNGFRHRDYEFSTEMGSV